MANVFETKAEMPKEGRDWREGFEPIGPRYECFPAGCSIGVDMTPEQRRNLNTSNYPRYDALDVQHAARPRFGHGY